MINVFDSYKLTKLDFNGKEIVVKAEDTTSWNVIKVQGKEGEITVNEGDIISFITESGENKKGSVIKLTGKKEKARITIIPELAEHEETWVVTTIKDGTLKVITDEVNSVDEEDMEDEE